MPLHPAKPDPLRAHLAKLLGWEDAHPGFDSVVKGVPPKLRGVRPAGLPYSLWELLEHLRLAQQDILEFCVDPAYREKEWPRDYWPPSPEPPDSGAWAASVGAVRADRKAFERLLADPDLDLNARIPHGQGQTYLREFLLVADHTAFHLGQMLVLRRLLDDWKH
ncbi:MAG TPA: DinB family protein [Holophagaceae bacterium]|nr:DinB family protein [Holophagaceae bacterium]